MEKLIQPSVPRMSWLPYPKPAMWGTNGSADLALWDLVSRHVVSNSGDATKHGIISDGYTANVKTQRAYEKYSSHNKDEEKWLKLTTR